MATTLPTVQKSRNDSPKLFRSPCCYSFGMIVRDLPVVVKGESHDQSVHVA